MQRLLQDRHARVERNYVGRQVSVGVDDKRNASVSEICRYGQAVPIVEMVVQDRARHCFDLEQFQRVRDRSDRTHDTPILILDGVRKIERQVDIVFDNEDGVVFEYAGLPLSGSASISQSSGLPNQPRR
jgi:NADH:ubiquinone oxidoreductase subunit B-like Fe-S oxidoreductase